MASRASAEAMRTNWEPVPGFRFAVEIQGLVAAWFMECGGLTIERQVQQYEEGGTNAYVHQLPGRIICSNITLKRGLADPALWKWFAGLFDGALYDAGVTRLQVSIVLYRADLAEAGRWTIPRAFPANWSVPQLAAEGDLVAIEALELAQGAGSSATLGTGSAVQRAVGVGERGPSVQEADLPALAQKVCALLRQELKVECARLGWNR